MGSRPCPFGVTYVICHVTRDVIGHVTIRLAVVNFLWVVHSDHVSVWQRYGDLAT